MEKLLKTRVVVDVAGTRMSFPISVNISESSKVSAGLPARIVRKLYRAGVYPKRTGIAGWYTDSTVQRLVEAIEIDIRALIAESSKNEKRIKE